MQSLQGGNELSQHLARRFRISDEHRDSIYQSILESSEPSLEYFMMLGLAALIALFGLLQNSAAVIIGAMLISPLMSPILSAALALLLGDGKLGQKSALLVGLSIVGAIVLTLFVASLSPLKELTPEILARTSPNLLDLFIAFLSGLAGTLALRSTSATLTILPGVAIAVAVIPPLAVVGYGLSSQQSGVAGGAFLLFLTNLVAIILSAALVFRLMGFRPHEEKEESRFKLKYRMGMSALVLIVLSIPLFQTLRKAVVQVRLRSDISQVLNATLKTKDGSISNLTFSQTKEGLSVRATLQTTRYFRTEEIGAAEESLREKFGPKTRLQIDQILVAQGGISSEEAGRMQNPISGGVVRSAAKEPAFDFTVSSHTVLAHLEKQVDETLQGTFIRHSGELRAEWGATPPLVIRLQLIAPQVLDSQTLALLASQLSSKLSTAVQLRGEVVLQGPIHNLTIESPTPRGTLGREDRQNLMKLVNLVRERPDLRLQISYTWDSINAASNEVPVLLQAIKALLSRSHLKPFQWSIQTRPPVASEQSSPGESKETTESLASGKPPRSAGPVHCEIKTYQEF